MRIIKISFFGLLVLFYSSVANSEVLQTLCMHNIHHEELEPYGVKHRLAIAEFDKERLDKLLNKIPRLKPETHNWVKEEDNSKDFYRQVKIRETIEYHQYNTIMGLKNLIVTLEQIIKTTQSIIELERDEITNWEHGEWVYYTTTLNDYHLINSLVKLYEKNIIEKPKDWEMSLQLSLCMNKVNKLIKNIIVLETYSY